MRAITAKFGNNRFFVLNLLVKQNYLTIPY